MGAELFLTHWFQGRNLLGDDQNLKHGWRSRKGGESNIKEESFFFFINQNSFSHFVPAYPDTTLKERSLG